MRKLIIEIEKLSISNTFSHSSHCYSLKKYCISSVCGSCAKILASKYYQTASLNTLLVSLCVINILSKTLVKAGIILVVI